MLIKDAAQAAAASMAAAGFVATVQLLGTATGSLMPPHKNAVMAFAIAVPVLVMLALGPTRAKLSGRAVKEFLHTVIWLVAMVTATYGMTELFAHFGEWHSKVFAIASFISFCAFFAFGSKTPLDPPTINPPTT